MRVLDHFDWLFMARYDREESSRKDYSSLGTDRDSCTVVQDNQQAVQLQPTRNGSSSSEEPKPISLIAREASLRERIHGFD
jgi:hypothetical protein